MGAGLARQIALAYPKVEAIYQRNTPKLGQVQTVQVGPHTWIANICAQAQVGHQQRQTDYVALYLALVTLNHEALGQVYLPYRLGCGLAGGDWNIVKTIIAETIPSAIIVQRKCDV